MPVAPIVPAGAARSSASNSARAAAWSAAAPRIRSRSSRQVGGDRGERNAAPVELLDELAFDARDGVSVVGAETAALEDDAADSVSKRRRGAGRGHQQRRLNGIEA